MATRKVSELQGAALDYAVALCQSRRQAADMIEFGYRWFTPSSDWAQGGPIIEREAIDLYAPNNQPETEWVAKRYVFATATLRQRTHQRGPTPLVAAMRCYVTSKLASNASGGSVSDRGDEIEIPDELL